MSAERPAPLAPRDLIVAAIVNLVWGLNIIAVKMSVEAVPPLAAGGLRLLVVLLVCISWLRVVPGRMRLLVTLGLLNGALFLIFVNLSLRVSDNVSALAIAGQLGVPFSLILGVVFLKERIALPRLIGIAMSFGGVVLLVFDPAVVGEVAGLLLTTLGTLAFAIGSLLQRRLAGVPVLTLYAWIGLIGAAVLFAMSAVMEPGAIARLPDLRLGDFGWILFSALGSTMMGQVGMAWLLQRHPIATVMPLTLGSPVIAVLASSLAFGTVLTPLMIVGGMITMTGVAIITLRSARPARPVP
ncbi:DMT family transporter [Sphingomonas profundi]|uniref:DMT family transporter n=1 Tax=Alterirhizorhabdus profundi TaxID=2681549 RepID=UPI0012E80D6E|nr:DMT family transporter [Sphingomonas profundi]